jgi:hypothetical protein
MVNPGHKKGTTTEILRNPNLSIKTPKKLTDEQTSRQQISFSGTLYSVEAGLFGVASVEENGKRSAGYVFIR